MTNQPTLQPVTRIPSIVRLGELAMAAGIAGFPVTLCYQDFPAPVLSQIWRYYIRVVGSETVHHVRTQSDLNKLSERISEVRLVLVHTPRLHIPTAWSIQLAESADAEGGPLPTMLSRFMPSDLDQDPGATLVVRATKQQATAVAQWLATQGSGHRGAIHLPSQMSAEFPVWLSPVLSLDSRSNGQEPRRFRDLQILRGLLAGACILRLSSAGETADSVTVVSPEDYESVRAILQSPILWPADAACDPLATAMVSRANVYLAIRFGEIRRYGNLPLGLDEDVQEGRGGPRKELITRREVADLGNVQSGMIHRLVDYLHQGADGYEWYCRMGLMRRPPNRDTWSTASVDSLTANLRPWSVKQVRTHFDRLRRDGLITAARDHENGPWRYELPEELTDASCPFHSLPPVASLQADGPDATADAA